MNDMSTQQHAANVVPLRRAPAREVEQVRRRLLLEETLTAMIEAIPDYVLVLNEQRQALAANGRFLKTFGSETIESFVGRRPGEALGCAFADEGRDGCGSGPHCTVCGAAASIEQCQRLQTQVTRECHFSLGRDATAALDLLVVSTPAVIDGLRLTVCVIKDISDEKRRSILERLFFHDVINTAGGIRGLAALLEQGETSDPQQETEYKRWLVELAERLIGEIAHQQKLLAAEAGEFIPQLGLLDVASLLRELQALYARHEVAAGIHLELGMLPDCRIESDVAILRRILGNLIKNALEASTKGETVTIAAAATAADVTFSVHNPGVIPEEVQLQLFTRSFSTKAANGRGLGTYSVKLFGERYLHGRVAFESREPEGTTFTLTLPRTLTTEKRSAAT